MTAKGVPSPEHQRLVQALVSYLNQNGWAVTHADGVASYPRPYEVDGKIPDIIARDSSGLLAYGEAETCEFLENDQTISQIDMFSNRHMVKSGQAVPLFIIVPAACSGQLAAIVHRRFPNRANIVRLYL